MIPIKLIGLSGKSGTGKDFIAREYLKPLGYYPFSLSWHFKVGTVGEGLATYDDVFYHKPPTVRHLLQQKGTEEGRQLYGENVWLNHAWAWMKTIHYSWGVDKFVISDIRFPNEVRFIHDMGGKVFRINAPVRAANSKLSLTARLHASETSLDLYSDFDAIIENDAMVSHTVENQILTALNV